MQEDKCEDDCLPDYLIRRLSSHSAPTLLFASLPFLLTFLIVFIIASQKLFPLITGEATFKSGKNAQQRLPLRSNGNTSYSSQASWKWSRKRLSAALFAFTMALSAVLAELILCEISNTLNPAIRSVALKLTISLLLILLILVIPFLEFCSVVSVAGYDLDASSNGRGPSRIAWSLVTLALICWIFAFWWVGKWLPAVHAQSTTSKKLTQSLRQACLERIGIIGISSMALLSGFAAVSSPWQTFGAKHRPVTESDLARKQAGLDSTIEMLAAKQSRLRALERKMHDAPPASFLSRASSFLVSSPDAQEATALRIEINGLNTMSHSLSSSLSVLTARRAAQKSAHTVQGKLVGLANTLFAVYCLYRVGATSLAALHRWRKPESSFATTDPINNVLALLAAHVDPALNTAAWARQISFLLAGIMLVASLSAVQQTVHLFSRYTPSFLSSPTRSNLPLLVGQVSATYVVAAALMLRSSLPPELGGVISDALGAPLDSGFVDRWFEGWFLAASVGTAVGIFVVRKLGVSEDGEWEDDEDVEMGKRS